MPACENPKLRAVRAEKPSTVYETSRPTSGDESTNARRSRARAADVVARRADRVSDKTQTARASSRMSSSPGTR